MTVSKDEQERWDSSPLYGAPTYLRPDGTGYDCELGHEHTYEQARQAQGWDYASDAGEAALLAKYGTEPREMDGHVWAGPLPFA
jgi:hypothetical protein